MPTTPLPRAARHALAVALAFALPAAVPAASQGAPELLFALESPNPEPGGLFGSDVDRAGDLDGDGVADLLVGAPLENGTSGRTYAFSGASGGTLLVLSPPDPSGFFGSAVAGLGDVDGDGVPDLLVGAPFDASGGPASGLAYVFSGATGGLLYPLESPEPELAGLFGGSVAGLGDLDGDAVPDLAVGAPGEGVGGVESAGRTYLFSGATGALLRTLESPDPTPVGSFGTRLAGLGDVDGDLVADLMVGAYGEDGGAEQAGRAYVFSGATGALVHTLESPSPYEGGGFGLSAAGLGDLDGDAVSDLAVGAQGEANGVERDGRAHVFSGATGALVRSLDTPNPGTRGRFGYVAGLGDLDGDAVPDLAVGANLETDVVRRDGRAYVFSGASGAVLYELTSPAPNADGFFGAPLVGLGVVEAGGEGAFGLAVRSGEGDAGGRVYVGALPVVVAVEPPARPAAPVSVWPNPFRERAVLSFGLAEAAYVRLTVHDGLGREVARLVDRHLPAGAHAVALEGRGWAVGAYAFRLVAGERVETGLLTRVR